MPDSRRHYFDNAPTPEPIGKPTWARDPSLPPCPHCGAECVVVTVAVRPPPMLRAPSGHAVTRYVGCPACPFASPAVTTAAPAPTPAPTRAKDKEPS